MVFLGPCFLAPVVLCTASHDSAGSPGKSSCQALLAVCSAQLDFTSVSQTRGESVGYRVGEALLQCVMTRRKEEGVRVLVCKVHCLTGGQKVGAV